MRLQAGGNIDPVTEDIVAVDNDVAEIDPDAEDDARQHETQEPAPVLEVLEPPPIGSAFEPDIEIPRQRRVDLRPG